VVRAPPGPLVPVVINPGVKVRGSGPQGPFIPGGECLLLWGDYGVKIVGPFGHIMEAAEWARNPRHNAWDLDSWKCLTLITPGREPIRYTPAMASARAAALARQLRAAARPEPKPAGRPAARAAPTVAQRREKARSGLGLPARP
jgi:hypothetical protein